MGVCLVAVSLALGMAGYPGYEGLPWLDALVNASMILSGMVPLTSPVTAGGKLFEGVFLAPVVHRFFHRFHLESENDEPSR